VVSSMSPHLRFLLPPIWRRHCDNGAKDGPNVGDAVP
jgi:hypothetical protein